MIVIVGSRYDEKLRGVLRAWAGDSAALLSAEDLITPGWVFNPAANADNMAVVAGQRVPVRDIRAVLTRRPSVLAQELSAIHPDDRDYVAAEINAFLIAWLSSLPCKVLNRPTTTSLCGPSWTHLYWKAAAAKCGLRFSTETAVPTQSVVVCGEQVLGTRSVSLSEHARALARLAGVQLLELHLHKGALLHVSTCPDLSRPALRALVRETLLDTVEEAS